MLEWVAFALVQVLTPFQAIIDWLYINHHHVKKRTDPTLTLSNLMIERWFLDRLMHRKLSIRKTIDQRIIRSSGATWLIPWHILEYTKKKYIENLSLNLNSKDSNFIGDKNHSSTRLPPHLHSSLHHCTAVILNLVRGTEPHKFHTCIHRTLRSYKNKMRVVNFIFFTFIAQNLLPPNPGGSIGPRLRTTAVECRCLKWALPETGWPGQRPQCHSGWEGRRPFYLRRGDQRNGRDVIPGEEVGDRCHLRPQGALLHAHHPPIGCLAGKRSIFNDFFHQNLKFPFQSKVMIKKTAEICRNSYVAEKRIVSKPQRYWFQILIAQIEDLKQDFVNILRSYL